LPSANGHKFGLVLLEVEPGSPAAQASLMAGDILLGTEEKPFQSIDDLARAMDGQGLRLLRLEFLRDDYSRVRCVTVQLGVSDNGKDRIAA
jgi:S1-C subfamily serine protease